MRSAQLGTGVPHPLEQPFRTRWNSRSASAPLKRKQAQLFATALKALYFGYLGYYYSE